MTAKDKTLTIACKSSLTLSAAAMGLKKDKKVSAFEKVTVPEGYGNHLISDGFAMLYADYKKANDEAKEAEAKRVEANKAAEAKAKAEADKEAKAQKAEDIKKAKGDLTAAKELLAETGDDVAAKDAAETAVKDAETALNALTAN